MKGSETKTRKKTTQNFLARRTSDWPHFSYVTYLSFYYFLRRINYINRWLQRNLDALIPQL